MVIRIALFAVPTVSVAVLVPMLNALDASPGIAVATLGLVAVLGGASFGVFVDRLPEFPWMRRNRLTPAAQAARRVQRR
jgi:hypothetical protein